MAGLTQIGVQMVVKGVSKFVNDVRGAAQAVYNYSNSVSRAEGNVARLAKAQVTEANIALRAANAEVRRITETYTRYSDMLTQLKTRQESLRQSYDSLKAANEQLDHRTKQYKETLVTLGNIKEKTAIVDSKIKAVTEQVATVEGRLATAQENRKGKQEALTAATENYNNVTQKGMGFLNALGQSFGVLLGSMDKNVTGGTVLARTLQVLNLRISALAFILQGVGMVLSTVGLAFSAIFGAVTSVVGVFAKLATTAFNLGRAIVTGVVGALRNLVAIPFNFVTGALSSIWNSLKRIGEIAIGMNLSNLIWNFGTQLKSLGESALEAAGDFQLLQIRMKALIQREQLEQNGTAFADSLDYATGKAKELTGWISQLAVKSIFSAEAISNTFTLGMAYDLTADKSKELTNAIVQFSTGMGLQEDQMRRIIENFGQMKAAGKLTGTEMRDLARGAFLPINRVLDEMAKKLGVTGENIGDVRTKLQKMVTDGTVPVEEFFDAFVRMTEKDFPNAVDKASKSWSVVKSNIKDFIQSVIGWRVIAPTLDLVSGRLSDFVSKFMTPDMIDLADKFGQAIAFVASGFLKLGDALTAKLFKGSISNVVRGFSAVLTGAQMLARSLGGPANDILKSFDKIREGLFMVLGRNMYNKIGANLTNLISQFVDVFANMGTVPIRESLSKLLKIIGDTWKLLWDEIVMPALSVVWSGVKSKVQEWWEKYILPAMLDLWENKFLPWFGEFWNTTLPEWWNGTAGPAMLNLINGLVDWATQSTIGDDIGKTITDKIVAFMAGASGPGSSFVTELGQLLGIGLKASLAAALNVMTGAGKEATADRGKVGGVDAGSKSEVGPLQKAIDDLGASAQKALDTSLKNFTQWARDTWEPIDKLYSVIKLLWETADKLVTPLAQIAGSFLRISSALFGGGGAAGAADKAAGGLASFLFWLVDVASGILGTIAAHLNTIADAMERTNKMLGGEGLFSGFLNLGAGGGEGAGGTNIFTSMIQGIIDVFRGRSPEVKAASDEMAKGVTDSMSSMSNEIVGNSIIPDMLTLMYDTFVTKSTEILNFVRDGFVTPMENFFAYAGFFFMGKLAMLGLYDGLLSVAESILAWFDSFRSKFVVNVVVSTSTVNIPSNIPNPGSNSTPTDKTKNNSGGPVKKVAKGANFVVPPGYPNDSFLMGVQTGEHVIVIPKAAALRNSASFNLSPTFSAMYNGNSYSKVTNKTFNWNNYSNDPNRAARYEYDVIRLLEGD